MIRAQRINISGIVQGVGYRPFIHIAALRYGLSGYVANKGGEVSIHAEGEPASIEAFFDFISNSYPNGAYVQSIQTQEQQVEGYSTFEIVKSIEDNQSVIGIPADKDVCDECKEDIFRPGSRYYQYPFTSCTKCGPRFTIVRKVPYDRCSTTMEPFNMCKECEDEFTNPYDRRYHAQTICCPDCGPQVRLVDKNGEKIANDWLEYAGEMLEKGSILAVKGIGGFHLVCNAVNNEAVERLREGKDRISKPFAVMFRDIESARRHCEISRAEEELMTGFRKPIVLLEQKGDSDIPRSVNPGLDKLGAMLPYSGIHMLLLSRGTEVLVVTSGNRSGFPLVTREEDAFEQLGNMVDAFLVHNREILSACDDSVTKVVLNSAQPIRRSRGYIPVPVILKGCRSPILACGSDLKNTFCMVKDERAYVSQHIGDIHGPEILKLYREQIERYMEMLDFQPEFAVCDMHPDFKSSQYARELGLPVLEIQHHHAHIAGVMAENGLEDSVIGVALDGTGYGNDGTIWGGEFLISSPGDFKRVGHFRKAAMPGGEAAVREPWRMAGIYLSDAFGEDLWNLNIGCTDMLREKNWPVIARSINSGLNTVITSSAGRLFDAVSAILGICCCNNYEGQASAELEARAVHTEGMYSYEIKDREVFEIDFRETIRGITSDMGRNINPGEISGKFHNTIVQVILEACSMARRVSGISTVVLSGGVFQNGILLKNAVPGLKDLGFNVYTNLQVPCNDGGISLGQAAAASGKIKNLGAV